MRDERRPGGSRGRDRYRGNRRLQEVARGREWGVRVDSGVGLRRLRIGDAVIEEERGKWRRSMAIGQ
jgi:hypothetical protein